MVPSLFGSKFPPHIDVFDPDTATVYQRELPILLASDVLHVLWEKQSPQLWDIVIGCAASKATSFWSQFRTSGASAELG